MAEVTETTTKTNWLLATENRRSAVIIPLWSLAITAIYAQALFQRAYLTPFDYGLVAAICFAAGAIIMDLGRALLNYVASMAIATFLLLTILSYPATTTYLPPPGGLLFSSLWVAVIFTAIFPLPLIAYLIAAVVGAAAGEKYF